MKVETLAIDPNKALELYRKYQSHRVHQTPADAEIAAIYKRIAQGKTVIRAFESIRAAGVNERGLPKLAICRADLLTCHLSTRRDEVQFSNSSWWDRKTKISRNSKVTPMEWPGFKDINGIHKATVPLIPVHLRPKRGLANYHILWEAEWSTTYPVDPYLLRRFGGDAWLVLAAWDLTEVERAVMSSRMGS